MVILASLVTVGVHQDTETGPSLCVETFSPLGWDQDVAPPKRDTCITSECHATYKNLRHSHGPVVLGRCLVCHQPDEDSTPYKSGDNHTFELTAKDGHLCEKCHESQAADQHVHYPIRRSRCVSCHDPHGSDHPAMMRRKRLADNCYECHEKTPEDEGNVHSPVTLGQCTACHDPHSSPYQHELRASGSALCLGCHTEKQQELALHSSAHRPVIEDCNQCHRPHDGPLAARLRKAVPELCFGCHEEIASKVHDSKNKHGALDDKRSCLYCHDAHAANFKSLVRSSPIKLCLSCHDKPIVTDKGVLRDMKTHLAQNKNHHEPIREGKCNACHDPHGSDNRRILRSDYPPEFYAPFDVTNYKLCFACHKESLVLEEATDTATDFRNGTKNLHYVHVNRSLKGRTCRACHDVHASTYPKQIASSVPFGSNWAYTIRYDKTADGGGCGPACHTARRYSRIRPLENK